MKERPIVFTGEMVRAILDGRKSQTRRVVKPQPPQGASLVEFGPHDHISEFHRNKLHWFVAEADDLWPCEREDCICCPYGQPGDRLWVREAFAYRYFTSDDPITEKSLVAYRADGESQEGVIEFTPAIYMPRWVSRITLEITNIRVERVQDISEGDAIAEGIQRSNSSTFNLMGPNRALFSELWDSINDKPGKKCSWEDNPWVWVIEFKKIKP